MWRVVLPSLLVLVGCPPATVEETGSVDDEMFWVYVASINESIAPEDGLSGLSLAAHGEEVHAAVEQLGVELSLWNSSTTSDCAVAIYASETPPDAGSLYAIDPSEDPPAEVAGLGELVAADNLPRIWDTDPTRVEIEWWADLVIGEAASVERHYSFVTCADPALTVQGGLTVTGYGAGAYGAMGDWSVDRSW